MLQRSYSFAGVCRAAAIASFLCLAAAGHAATARILDVGDSWVFFPYALQNPPALDAVFAEPEFNLSQYGQDGSIGLTNIFSYGWDTPEYFQKIHDRLTALPTIDICHVSIGGNDFVHGWKIQMSQEEVDALLDGIVGHVRNIIQYCLSVRPDVRVAVIGYDYMDLYDGYTFDAFGNVTSVESITNWAITYWGNPQPQTRAQLLPMIAQAQGVWVELERRVLEMCKEFPRRVEFVNNFGVIQHYAGIPNAPGGPIAPEALPLPDGPENNYANFPGGRPDLWNPRSHMLIEDTGEMDPMHLSADSFVTFMRHITRQVYKSWLDDSTAPQVLDIHPLAGQPNPTDNAQVVFEVTFTEAVTGVDAGDFALRTAGTIAGAAITDVSGSGATYEVTVSGITGAGTVALDLIDNDTIYDHVWYPLKRLGDGSFRTGAPFWIGGGLLACGQSTAMLAQADAFYTGSLSADFTAADLDADGIVDRGAVALLARILCDLSNPAHGTAQASFNGNLSLLQSEASFASFSANATGIAALMVISPGLRDAAVTALGLANTYTPLQSAGKFVLGPAGDPDGDELLNLAEYEWVVEQGAGAIEYAIAASTAGAGPPRGPACLDPQIFDTQGDAFYEALGQGVEWEQADWGDNGIPDRYDVALMSVIYCDGEHPLHDALVEAYNTNIVALEADIAAEQFLPFEAFMAMFAATSQTIADRIRDDMVLSAPLIGLSIGSGIGAEEPFSDIGDLDDDGASNFAEYVWTFIRGGLPDEYADEASDPLKTPTGSIPNCDYAAVFSSQGHDLYAFLFSQEDAWEIADLDQGQTPDKYDVAVLAALLCDATHPLHDAVQPVYDANLAMLRAETNIPFLQPVLDVVAALCTIDSPFAETLTVGFSLTGTYTPVLLGTDQPLSSLGDLDGDTKNNLDEFTEIGGSSAPITQYVMAVLGFYYPPTPLLTIDNLATNNPQPRITGHVNYATDFEISLDGGTIWAPIEADGDTWSYLVPAPLADGVYDIKVRAIGAFDREGIDNTIDELLIDTVAPTMTLIGPNRVTVEAGSVYVDLGATASDNTGGDITDRIVITSGVDTGIIDSFSVTFNVTDAAGNPGPTLIRIVDVRDRTSPTITLLGGPEIQAAAGRPYQDPGFNAIDNLDGNINANVLITGTVDTSIIGDYTLTYSVADSSQNPAVSVQRLIHVVDFEGPEIVLTGGSPYYAPSGRPFVEPGVSAIDLVDGDVSDTIEIEGTVGEEIGTYQLIYTAHDRLGNEAAPTVRIVQLYDGVPPVITILGQNPVTVQAGSEYVDAGATALDAVKGDVTATMLTVSNVDTSVLGDWAVAYTAGDEFNNLVTGVRTVHVVDTTPPFILLNFPELSTVIIEAGQPYIDPGAIAGDSFQGDLTSSLVVDNQVNFMVPGAYTFTYMVADALGNVATPAVRHVNVVDTTPPTLTMNGDAVVNVPCNENYVDAGANAYDVVDGDRTANITVQTSAPQLVNGIRTFTVTYRSSDTRGNIATPKVRTVNIAADCGHAADANNDYRINFNELLRLIQFYNVGTLHCVPGSEDGFDPGPGDESCTPHSSDYNPRNWSISFQEVLRAVQFYNVGGYYPCPGTGSEDGFCTPDQGPVVTLNGDAFMIVPLGTEFVDPGATAFDLEDGDVSESIEVSGFVGDAVGQYQLVYTAYDNANHQSAPTVRIVQVADIGLPVITILGDNPVVHQAGTAYHDAGATAMDDIDGDITNSLLVAIDVNVQVPGQYAVTYTAHDQQGNSQQAVRIVQVADEVAPVIQVLGSNPVTHQAGTPYVDAGATAFDALDGDLTDAIVASVDVDGNAPGDYTVTYTVQDGQGNFKQATRLVHVVDTGLPVITLIGAAQVSIEAGTPYIDAGATATDAFQGDLTSSLQFNNGVNFMAPGFYTYTYTVSDNAGNAATPAIRNVTVVDTTPPVITLFGDSPLLLGCGVNFADPGAAAFDVVDGDRTMQLSIVYSQPVVDGTTQTFTATYSVSDTRGNAATPLVRTVTMDIDCQP